MRKIVSAIVIMASVAFAQELTAGPREQAKRIFDRIAGVPPSVAIINQMADTIENGPASEAENAVDAAYTAMQDPDFYRTTLKNLATPWTNREFDIFAPLNDYSATVIGLVRDDADFRQVLNGKQLYVGNSASGAPAYSTSNNEHYEYLERQGADLAAVLEARQQSDLTGIPDSAAAGVLTSRAAAKAFFIAGTNRAMFRFTLVNHLCRDLEQVSDITRPPDRIRQDITRSPGGDSRLYRNNCIGCHSGMDPLAQAFAYYSYDYDSVNDPSGESGRLTYNDIGAIDAITQTRVVSKYFNNQNNFPPGYQTPDDHWDNYWRKGSNQRLGWDQTLPGSGDGANSMATELANSQAFAQCQVKKVFRVVCLRSPTNSSDRAKITEMSTSFVSANYNLKQPFAESAAYCRGD